LSSVELIGPRSGLSGFNAVANENGADSSQQIVELAIEDGGGKGIAARMKGQLAT
jgi:hypothetical protein